MSLYENIDRTVRDQTTVPPVDSFIPSLLRSWSTQTQHNDCKRQDVSVFPPAGSFPADPGLSGKKQSWSKGEARAVSLSAGGGSAVSHTQSQGRLQAGSCAKRAHHTAGRHPEPTGEPSFCMGLSSRHSVRNMLVSFWEHSKNYPWE